MRARMEEAVVGRWRRLRLSSGFLSVTTAGFASAIGSSGVLGAAGVPSMLSSSVRVMV